MLIEDVFDLTAQHYSLSCVTFGDRAFSSYALKIGNKMQVYIKNSQFETFKVLLKSHLFQEVYK